MGRVLDAVRFFRVVPPVPRLLVASFVAVTMAGGTAILLSPDGAPRAVIPILLLQLFAASAGFAASARRGYYDVLLTSGAGRLRAAVVHWVMSVAPGVLSCAGLALVEACVSTDARAVASSGTIAALFVVSTIPWAATVSLPRFSGAIGWMLVSVMALTLLPQTDGTLAAWTTGQPQSAWQAASTLLLFPMEMVGRDIGSRAPAITAGLLLACASMGIALAWIHRTDLPLEAAQ